jgi:hypothetical protein
VAVKNKAQKWVFQALQQIIARMPFPVRGIDSDNGAEFINHQLIRCCNIMGIRLSPKSPSTW